MWKIQHPTRARINELHVPLAAHQAGDGLEDVIHDFFIPRSA